MGGRATTILALLTGFFAAAAPAISGPEEGAAPVYRSEAEVPPDPTEQGPGSARFVLLDAATGQPVKSTLDLWRLDAPGNSHWLRGDQYQDHGDTEDAFDHLPLGRYRICVHAQRRDSEDPPAVVVTAKETTHTFRVPMPRTATVRVFLFDDQGAPIRRAHISSPGRTVSSHTAEVIPVWRKERKLRAGQRTFTIGGGAGGSFGSRLVPHVDTGQGFDLGEVHEASRTVRTTRYCQVHVQPGVEAEVPLAFDGPGQRVLHAVVMPLQRIHDAVRLPDGRRAIDAGANIHVMCRTRPAKPGAPADLAQLPSQVRAAMRGYYLPMFDVHPGQPLEQITMKPVK